MDPYIGQIAVFGFNYAPIGWAPCNGQLLQIDDYTALFSLIGTTYGGDGQTTFGLPDLRGCASVNQGQGPGLSIWDMGEFQGSEQVTLTLPQLARHSHQLMGATTGQTQPSPANAVLGPGQRWNTTAPDTNTNASSIGFTGGNQPHDNMQPYLAVNFCIALEGIYPPRS
jgi:microcystin-dependent protein